MNSLSPTAAARPARIDAALMRAPITSLEALVGAGPVFVLAPHPDDESIGCGGLIASCVAAGAPVFVRVVTDGRHSHPGSAAWPPHRIALKREAEARRAALHLGLPASAIAFERAIDGALIFDWAGAQRLAERIASEMRRWPRPVLVAPQRTDPHPDHLAVSMVADLAERACPRAKGLRYMIWGDDNPHQIEACTARTGVRRLPIAAHRMRKRRAIFAHRSQVARLIEDDPKPGAKTPALGRFLGDYEIYFASWA